jgi:DUF4097 and DUF4098 domain-containing protein YvlB
MMKLFTAVFVCLFFMGTTALANDSVKLLELSGSDIEILDIDCEAGFLKVYGIPNLDKIEVKAEIDVDIRDKKDMEDFIQDRIRLSLKKKGQRAVLISHVNNSGFFSRNARINLTVRIPKNMNLRVEDGSGFIEIRDVIGDLWIDDGSGSIELTDITGDVEIDDGSGEIEIDMVNGNVTIDDGSGEIEADHIQGDLYIDDGSGTMDISNIAGNVVVRDGSGSININGVEKDVEIKEAGSGGLSIHDVKGRVTKRD